MVRSIVVAALTAVAATTVSAQTGPYRLAPADTLRYHEVTNAQVVVETPQGGLTTRSEHDATVHLVSSGPGRARAWYAALRLRAVGPTGDQSPNTAPMVGRAYELAFPADGRVTLVGAPDIPADIAQISDLTQQFFDFFVPMPAAEPRVGDRWQDTLHNTTPTPPTTRLRNEAFRTFQVRGDTVVAGRRALVIDVTTTARIEATAPLEGDPVEVTSSLAGSSTGVVIFDWAAGRLLHRTRTGDLRGAFRLEGGGQVIEFPQSYTFTATIDLAP